MKRLLSIAFLLCAGLGAFSQRLESGSFDGLKDIDRIAVDVDFSNASIHGMSEKAFAKYECDWYKDKPEIVAEFVGGIAERLASVISVADKSETRWLLRINVENVGKSGGFYCSADLLDGENVEAHLTGLQGPGGHFGSKLNLIKDGVKKTSKRCGSFIRSLIKKAKK